MKEIPLSLGMVALVDDEDYETVIAVGPWHAYRGGGDVFYARHSFTARRQVGMHGFITGWRLVDHINGDGLDNQRHNLREATVSLNLANRGLPSNNTSGYKGVSQRPSGRWVAQIKVRGCQFTLGTFDTPEDAARSYDVAAIDAWGEFARPNFPEECPA